ncbi:MAG: response regulator, partial [Tannerellaceae bacterium]
ENNIFCAGKSANLYRFNKDKFYILSDSIYLYNQSTKSLTAATVQGNDIIFPSLYMVENTGNISYLHGASELFEVNHVQNTIRTVFSSSDSVGIISAACRNNKGAFWLGSANGLFYYSPANGTAVAIENDRFIGTTSLGFDQSGRLWVGTHNALYVYIPETGKIIACSESDGVSGNEYIDTPPLLTRSGDLYMAGVMGLVFIKNNVSFPENMNPVISLLDVDLNGASVNALVDRKDNFLSVPWNYTSLSAKVIVKGSDLMQKELFRYYIHGDVEKVIEVPSRSIALHSLSTGNYQIWVSYNKKNGDWSKPVMLLSLVVTPPWWKSGWFICCILLFLFISVTFLLWLFIKHKENKMFRAMKEHEQKTYEEKIRFLINISHELRTPLTLVYAPLKRILNSGLVENGELLTQLSDIFKQTRRIRDLINMTLNIRKMEVGEESLNMQNVDLNIWIRTIVGDFSHELAAHNIRLAYDLDLSAGSIVFDSQKCETVLSNLLMNALKFSDPDSCITITSRRGEDNMRIEVSDEGIGLGNTDATRLFTRFYQGEHGRKGSGIGLSYAKLLVELHGGKIGAFNNAEKGATFFFELPIDNQTRTIEAHPYLNDLLVTTEKEEEHVVSADFVVGRYSVLIVEDEAELCQYLKNALKESFKQVYAAGNGAEGLEQALLYHPDIIVSDVMMPVMDGFELCRQIKSNLEVSHIPIILLTARTDSASTLLGYKQGADLYVPKPFDLSFLQTVISNLLHNREVVKLRYKENTLVVSPQMDTISNADEQFMQKLNILIIDQLESPELDVNFVAEQMAMSRASLYNKLKSLTDISIGDYINKFRMVKAIELLSNTELSIMEVSEKVGFTNQRYFSTVFKQAYGTTPSQYRKEKLVAAD